MLFFHSCTTADNLNETTNKNKTEGLISYSNNEQSIKPLLHERAVWVARKQRALQHQPTQLNITFRSQ